MDGRARLIRLASRSELADDEGMSGPIERAIRAHVTSDARLVTPSGRATFIVHEINDAGLVLLLGQKQAWTPLSWRCLEGLPAFLRGRGWVLVGANRELPGEPSTLDGYLERWLKRQTANYVAVVLEQATLVELDRDPPARIRWASSPLWKARRTRARDHLTEGGRV